jgi:nucleotide-binding universal stress UspA family protein
MRRYTLRSDNSYLKGFFRLLVAIDGSESSMKAADLAITMLRDKDQGSNTELIVLHVIYSEIKDVYFTYSNIFTPGSIDQNAIIEDAKKDAQKWFDKVQVNANKNDVRLRREIIVNSRSIVGAIVDCAEQKKVDLIVIGSRGLSGFKKLLLGSVASGVVTYSHCPVLVVK